MWEACSNKMKLKTTKYLFNLRYVTSFVSFIKRYNEDERRSRGSLNATLIVRDFDEETTPDAIISPGAPLFGYKPTMSP